MEINNEIPKGAFLAPEDKVLSRQEVYETYINCLTGALSKETIATICDIELIELEEIIKEFESK